MNSGQTDFEIDIGTHGKDTTLEFFITPGAVASEYSKFIPIGIALRETDDVGTDPTGTIEFPSVSIEDDDDGNRVLTLDVVADKNEAVTWDFFLVIQGTPAANASTGYDIGIIDPRIRGTTAD